MNNCQWKSIQEEPMPKGAHVFLRMSNRGNIFYAIGATDLETGEIVVPGAGGGAGRTSVLDANSGLTAQGGSCGKNKSDSRSLHF